LHYDDFCDNDQAVSCYTAAAKITYYCTMHVIVSVKDLCKTYHSGFHALQRVSLDIADGEILALLGPNGAGKTTLISIICGIVSPSSGTVTVNGFDNVADFRKTRELIGLVPQELTLGQFDTVMNTVRFSRGLFGKKRNDAYLEQLLKDLSLFDKKDSELRALSGGMKRRVLIAKALSHEPRILFLDEPTAGVDVELRKDMWNIVRRLRESGVTIILTTHYIEEAEAIADRIGVVNKGELLLVEDKKNLMQNLGKKQMIVELKEPITTLPQPLAYYRLILSDDGNKLTYTYDTMSDSTGITALLQAIHREGMELKDLHIRQSSLEDIFVDLVKIDKENPDIS
jgi:ABC-2 type transport system ATP-binding protein